MTADISPFAKFAPIYRDLGMWPRPLLRKAPVVKHWPLPDHELPSGTVDDWIKKYPNHNIGIVGGSPFPDGTLLGFLDIDHDLYVGLGRTLLCNPRCARLGKKGIVFPCRYTPDLKEAKEMRVKGEKYKELGKVAEFLFKGSQCVIPPSVHPDTGLPYEWIGTPLHEMDFNDLPLIGE